METICTSERMMAVYMVMIRSSRSCMMSTYYIKTRSTRCQPPSAHEYRVFIIYRELLRGTWNNTSGSRLGLDTTRNRSGNLSAVIQSIIQMNQDIYSSASDNPVTAAIPIAIKPFALQSTLTPALCPFPPLPLPLPPPSLPGVPSPAPTSSAGFLLPFTRSCGLKQTTCGASTSCPSFITDTTKGTARFM
jgi:hypothetical protein